jgi:poly[(R)-3-hydroxyalkanoate] polymerase subunit PhaC
MEKSATPNAGTGTWTPPVGPATGIDLNAALKPGTAAALADIASRSGNLLSLYAERLTANDAGPPIDPRAVATTVQEFMRQAKVNPVDLVKQQSALCSDLALLWQRTAANLLSNEPAEPVATPAKQDKRFKSEAWTKYPAFDFLKQSYLLMSRYFESSIGSVKGVDPKLRHKAQFYTRQFVNALSPTNFAMTNPAVLEETVKTRGDNLISGLRNLVEDLERGGGKLTPKMTDLEAFKFGKNIANTPGKVIFQNDLMQLIQYAPATETVHRRPLLIVPPWINKFYILDLKPQNSFIKWCVDQGHTVFVISWVNPGPELAAKNFSDYLLEGPIAAVDAIEKVTGEADINAIGYCIGGTLLASTLAYMAATGDKRIVSATFFTTLLDFSEVGDISVFIDDAQLDQIERDMKRKGFLEGRSMSEAFNLMRENDLIWFFFVNNYLLGRDPPAFDLLYWNSDATRMPAAMQSYYLRNMYQRNVLKQPGGITLANVPIDLRKIDIPVYFLSAREDHIAPWRSTYAGTQLVSGPIRFVLGSSGHIAGVINPPSANKYGYWTNERTMEGPDAWLGGAEFHPGSWWSDWAKWAAEFGGGQATARQPGGGALAPIEDAPGSYVGVRIS